MTLLNPISKGLYFPARTPTIGFSGTRRRRPNSAFTLLEVVLAITILAGLSATVYQVVNGSAQCAALLEENQRQNDRMRTLFETLRTTFQTLPGGGTIEVETIESDPLIQEVNLIGVTGAFPIGANPASKGDTTLSIREQPLDKDNPERGTLYTLAMTREDFAPPEDGSFGPGLRVEAEGIGGSANSGIYSGGIPDDDFTADDQGRYWFPLMKNIRAIEWGIYDPDEENFVTEWAKGEDRPKMIELNLLLEGWEVPVRGVFTVADIPTTQKPTSLPEGGVPAGTELGQPGGGQPGGGQPGGPPGGPPAAGGPGAPPQQGGGTQPGGPPAAGSPGGPPQQGGGDRGGRGDRGGDRGGQQGGDRGGQPPQPPGSPQGLPPGGNTGPRNR